MDRREPRGFATLAVRHMFRTVTPQGWQITTTNGPARAAVIGIICWAGIAALAWLVQHDQGSPWWVVAVFLAAALVAYAPFQPMYRYIYPFYQLLLFSAAAGTARLTRGIRGLNCPGERAT